MNNLHDYDFKKIFESPMKPLIHYITNYVTVNDVANMTLAFGGSPIMAEAIEDINEITPNCHCLVINIGTIITRKMDSIRKAIEIANNHHIPVILDPVGVAASSFRKEIVFNILDNYTIDVIKGNVSEMKALLGLQTDAKGVDSEEIITEDINTIGVQVANKYNTVAAITGKVDTICSTKQVAKIEGGSPIMTDITGTGCMVSPLIAVSLARSGDPFASSVYGLLAMKVAAEIAHHKLSEGEGVGTFKVKLFDNIYNLRSENLLNKGKVAIYEIE